MSYPNHAKLLRQGVEVWNKWRREQEFRNPDAYSRVHPYLMGVNLRGVDLSGVDLSGAHAGDVRLINANLSGADLSEAALIRANLSGADLRKAILLDSYLNDANLGGADLSGADMRSANLSGAILTGANLTGANLRGADLRRARLVDTDLNETNLTYANLDSADLSGARLIRANLDGANLIRATLGDSDLSYADLSMTIFGRLSLHGVKGLETVRHHGPSEISLSAIHQSGGKIPEVFLRGCGLSDWQIENVKLFQPELSNQEVNDILYRIYSLRAHQAIQISPLFISYSHADGPFVDEMEKHLNKKGIRFWRDVHHATAGRLERQVDRAIRLNPTVLLVLSKHAVRSDWVQHEARLARELEMETGRDLLCPVALDDSWKRCRWPVRLREQIMEYNILDFTSWRDADHMQRMFTRLIEGLGLFYK